MESISSEAKGIHVSCDECGQEWFLKPVAIVEAKVQNADQEDELTVRYFSCPRCEKVFVINLFDKQARELQKKSFKVRDKLMKAISSGDVNKVVKADKRFQKVSKKFNRSIVEVSRKYRGSFTLADDGSKDLLFVPFQAEDESKGELQ